MIKSIDAMLTTFACLPETLKQVPADVPSVRNQGSYFSPKLPTLKILPTFPLKFGDRIGRFEVIFTANPSERALRKCMDILKSIYEFIGTPYPKLSLILVTMLGAAVFAGVWLFAAKQVAKDHQNEIAPSGLNGPASTTGSQSPAVTGNGNSINYEQSSPGKKPELPK